MMIETNVLFAQNPPGAFRRDQGFLAGKSEILNWLFHFVFWGVKGGESSVMCCELRFSFFMIDLPQHYADSRYHYQNNDQSTQHNAVCADEVP
jgi:hypothetical protein